MHDQHVAAYPAYWSLEERTHILDDTISWAVLYLRATSTLKWQKHSAKEKKQHITPEAFVKVCFESGEKDEAAKHVARLPLGAQKDWFVKLQKFEEAVKLAVQARDLAMLDEIQQQVPAKLRDTKLILNIFAAGRAQLGA